MRRYVSDDYKFGYVCRPLGDKGTDDSNNPTFVGERKNENFLNVYDSSKNIGLKN